MSEPAVTGAAPPHPPADRVVWLLTLLVVVDDADRAVLGAVAPAVREDLSLSLTDLGLLGASFGIVGGLATVIAGVLVDRVRRLRLLALSALGWAIAMVATGAVFGVIASGNGGDDEGLQLAFLLALPGIALAGVMLLRAAATYDEDRRAVLRHDAVEAGP